MRTINYCFCVLCCALLAGCCAKMHKSGKMKHKVDNTLTKAEINEGWKLMFDGKSTNGWHTYGKETIGSAWQVKDNTLMLDASNKQDWQVKGGGDIIFDEQFDNFIFQVDWKISKGGNSGIMLYINEDKAKFEFPWNTGPEMQILDNGAHADAKIYKHRAGDLYDLIPSSKEMAKPPMEWNHVEIKSINGKLDFFLNGQNVVSVQMWGDEWKKLILGSKFKDMEGFGTYKLGKIGLQDHGNDVWFKNIKIRKL